MPVFTFEKILPEKLSPPALLGPVSETSEPRARGVIAQIFSRLSDARLQRKTKGVIVRKNGAFEKSVRD